MEEYRQWLEQQIERCLNDKDLQREHWAFCKAYEKFIALRQPPVSGMLPPTNDEIDAMVEEFVQGLNVHKKVKRNVAFGYQEGLYKMRELWR